MYLFMYYVVFPHTQSSLKRSMDSVTNTVDLVAHTLSSHVIKNTLYAGVKYNQKFHPN